MKIDTTIFSDMIRLKLAVKHRLRQGFWFSIKTFRVSTYVELSQKRKSFFDA